MTKYMDCSLDSLKSRWTQKILPAVNKFQGICETNPPTSGELKDDAAMDKYYGRMRELYAERAKANTWKDWKGPKRFEEFMLSYLWLQDQPRFASLFEQDKAIDAEEPDATASKRRKKMSTKVPVGSTRPQGRDSAKHANVISAVTEHIAKQVSTELNLSSGCGNTYEEEQRQSFARSIKDGMKDLKDGIMEMAQSQMETAQCKAMASAPSPMKKDF